MDDRFRISDADRDHVAALLRDQFAAGRLTAEDLDERLTAMLNATTFGDLHRVLADLPEPAPVLLQADTLPPERGGLERATGGCWSSTRPPTAASIKTRCSPY